MQQCLLVKIPNDTRQFFTDETNYPNLIEFCKTFDAQMFVVHAENPKILALKELSSALCDHTVDLPKTEYNIVEAKSIRKSSDKLKISSAPKLADTAQSLKKISNIREYLCTTLLSGNTVAVKDLFEKFKAEGMSLSTFYRHMNHVRTNLENNGYKVIKTAPGIYKAEK